MTTAITRNYGSAGASRTLPGEKTPGRPHTLQAAEDGTHEKTVLINIKISPEDRSDFENACAKFNVGVSVGLRTLIEALRAGHIEINNKSDRNFFERPSFTKSGFILVPAYLTQNDALWFDQKYKNVRKDDKSVPCNIKANIARHLMHEFSRSNYPHITLQARQTFQGD
ncbi:hypothetical protein R6242_19555 [Iodobacter sp. CM08]|uniref:hypothetical protein n=1 Tax=Iodobacter sp. CM08 TaxID=3085902 RepID=UPI0029819283|nr:hypothetical protein [Iodobacter sp. CM08]MDW5418769.1 hypothetical protein [Iodobacter sp. CM08]